MIETFTSYHAMRWVHTPWYLEGKKAKKITVQMLPAS